MIGNYVIIVERQGQRRLERMSNEKKSCILFLSFNHFTCSAMGHCWKFNFPINHVRQDGKLHFHVSNRAAAVITFTGVQGKGLVVCGDDKGSLWLYNLQNMVDTSPTPIKSIVDPVTRLMWPELQVFKNSFDAF